MTNLPPSIREKAWLELRRLLNSCAVNPNGIPMLMVEWLWQHLSESAGEFDEEAAVSGEFENAPRITLTRFVQGARWQYEQCKQRVALFESDRRMLTEQLIEMREKLAAAEAKLAKPISFNCTCYQGMAARPIVVGNHQCASCGGVIL